MANSPPQKAGSTINDSANPEAMEQAAEDYAKHGWHVFPVANTPPMKRKVSHSKPPTEPYQRALPPDATLGGSWSGEETTDVDTVESWWNRWPEAMPGIATGAESNLLVLQVTKPRAVQVAEMCATLPSTVTATAGGSIEYYFHMPNNHTISKQAESIPNGILVRGNTQYVLPPPSIETGTVHWRWEHAPGETPLAEIPKQIVERMLTLTECPPPDGGTRLEEAKAQYLPDALNEVRQGRRHPADAAKDLTRKLRDAGLDMVSEAKPIMCEFVEQCAKYDTSRHPFTEKRALSILKGYYVPLDGTTDEPTAILRYRTFGRLANSRQMWGN
jgi:hypothetical protein